MDKEDPKIDARLKEGVAYFEQMLKVMPEDRTTLEFLAVAYLQMGEAEKAEKIVVSLARVLLKENDLENAKALLDRLDAGTSPEAKAMAIRVRVATSPRPELAPDVVSPDGGNLAPVLESEATLAQELDEVELADQMYQFPDTGRLQLVSALAMLEKDRPDACERAISTLADRHHLVPIPLDAFEPIRDVAAKLPADVVRVRGVIPFARLGEWTFVAFLSPHDAALRRRVADALGLKVRFFLALPAAVEAALVKLYPELGEKNA